MRVELFPFYRGANWDSDCLPYGLAQSESQDSNPDLTPVGEWEWDVILGMLKSDREALRLGGREAGWLLQGRKCLRGELGWQIRRANAGPFPATVLTQKPTRTWPWRGRKRQPLDMDSVKTRDGVEEGLDLTFHGGRKAREPRSGRQDEWTVILVPIAQWHALFICQRWMPVCLEVPSRQGKKGLCHKSDSIHEN